MNHTPPTGIRYRAALDRLRATDPDGAAAIADHVRHTNQLLARLQAEQPRLQARIDELIAYRATPGPDDAEDTALLVVTNDGDPITTSSSSQIVEAAMDLVGQLLDPTTNAGDKLSAASVYHGPLAAPIFSIALQFWVEESRPIFAAMRAQLPTP